MTEAELKELRRQVEKLEERVKWLEAKMTIWEQRLRELVKKKRRAGE